MYKSTIYEVFGFIKGMGGGGTYLIYLLIRVGLDRVEAYGCVCKTSKEFI